MRRCDRARAQDLVQATFERTYRSWSKARDGDPRAYARHILVNLRIDGWRRTRRRAQPGPTDELISATYAADGTVTPAGFLRSGGGIEWNYAYLPND